MLVKELRTHFNFVDNVAPGVLDKFMSSSYSGLVLESLKTKLYQHHQLLEHELTLVGNHLRQILRSLVSDFRGASQSQPMIRCVLTWPVINQLHSGNCISFYRMKPHPELPLSRFDKHHHYNDVIMSAIASQITSITIVCSTVYSGGDQRKHESSASLAFVRGIHWWRVNSPHKGPLTRKMFPFDDVSMIIVGVTFSQHLWGNWIKGKRQFDVITYERIDVVQAT